MSAGIHCGDGDQQSKPVAVCAEQHVPAHNAPANKQQFLSWFILLQQQRDGL
jgi:hypothetical protein